MSVELTHTEGLHVLRDGEALVEIYATGRRPTTTLGQGQEETLLTDYNVPLQPKRGDYIPWGADNKFPLAVAELNSRNPVSAGLIGTKADFVAGRELAFYRKRVENGQIYQEFVRFPEGEEWLEANEARHQLARWTRDIIELGNCGVQMIRNASGNGIAQIWHTDPNLFRVGQARAGLALTYKLADWINDSRTVMELPAYNRAEPLAYQNSFLHVKNYAPGSFYYGVPDWIGAENFIRLLNEIPVWHLAGIRNGYNIKYHIKIPSYYFEKFPPEKRRAKEEELRDEMNNFLAGSQQNAKTLVTKFFVENGKPVPGVEVTPIQANLNDNAFTQLFNQGMIAVCSAHGINPSLAGVILNSQLSSGSELRNAYNMYLQLKVPHFRDLVLKPLYEVKRANGWPADLQIGLIGHQVTRLDENSEGGVDVMA